ncbi:Transposase, IS4 family protein, partial [Acidiphilium sp. PM]
QPGNPYDGHTLAGQIEQVERITGVAVARAYVDRGYRGHGVEAEGRRIFISRQKRGITPTIRRELRRRTAIEPVIGHMKTDGHLGRNFLLGFDGDAINAILAGAGHNLRLLRRWLIRLLCAIFTWLSAARPSPDLRLPNYHIA